MTSCTPNLWKNHGLSTKLKLLQFHRLVFSRISMDMDIQIEDEK